MTDDLLERIEGCIANAEHEDEHETLIDARDRIIALIAAGDRLAGFAEHDFGCLYYERNDSCDCGYTDALKAWRGLTS